MGMFDGLTTSATAQQAPETAPPEDQVTTEMPEEADLTPEQENIFLDEALASFERPVSVSFEDAVDDEISDLEDLALIVSEKGMSPDLLAYLNRDGSLETLLDTDAEAILAMEPADLGKRLETFADTTEDRLFTEATLPETVPDDDIEGSEENLSGAAIGALGALSIISMGTAIGTSIVAYQDALKKQNEEERKTRRLIAKREWSNDLASTRDIRTVSQKALLERFTMPKEAARLKAAVMGDLPKTEADWGPWASRIEEAMTHFTSVYGIVVNWDRKNILGGPAPKVRQDKTKINADQKPSVGTAAAFGYGPKSCEDLSAKHITTLFTVLKLIRSDVQAAKAQLRKHKEGKSGLLAAIGQDAEARMMKKAVRTGVKIYRRCLWAYVRHTDPMVGMTINRLLRDCYVLTGSVQEPEKS